MKRFKKRIGRNAFGEKAILKTVILERENPKETMYSALLDIAKTEREKGQLMEYTFSFQNFSKEEAEELMRWLSFVSNGLTQMGIL